jgi:hypothetical protein
LDKKASIIPQATSAGATSISEENVQGSHEHMLASVPVGSFWKFSRAIPVLGKSLEGSGMPGNISGAQ